MIDRASSDDTGGSSDDKHASSDDKGNSSTHKSGSSSHKSGSSSHKGESSSHKHLDTTDPCADEALLQITGDIREAGRVAPELMRQTILTLCASRFLTVQQLGVLLDRAPAGLRERFIKPMLDEGLLERRFPQQPNHEQHAYRTRSLEHGTRNAGARSL